ncbi:MAG TPA: 50S ribosomal protein L25/general stress protein Ctc [Myxococcota bacterium]|nr:50S ribosomal protein L25/general stress protein Ctc [Myxococcota bacterium]
MADTALHAQKRDKTGKGVGRKLRAAGRIPAVLYGRGTESVPLAVEPRALEKVLAAGHAGMNTLIDLQVDGGAQTVVLVKELQRDPVKGTLLHADLYRVDLSQTIEVAVPLHIVGTAQGVALSGGILDFALREIEIECLPRAIPDQIDVDVSALDIGESLHVRDIVLPQGVTLKSDPDLSVVSVVAPAAEEVPVAAPAAPVEGEAAAAAPAAGTETKTPS